MELFLPIERVLWGFSVLAEALVAVRFFREGLVRRYPFFVAFLIAEVFCSIILMQFNLKSRNYAEAYRIFEPIITIFRLGVAAELYERICEHFPGIGLFRAVMASIFVLLAALVAIFSAHPNFARQWTFPQTIPVLMVLYQGEILAGALILTWIFLRFFLSIRQPFRPNVLTHWTIATVYFAALAVGYIAILLSHGGKAVFPINSAILAIQTGCFIAWFQSIHRTGEELPQFARLSPDQVQAVESYNRELLGAVRSLPGEISARQAENRDIPSHRAGAL